MNRYITQHPPDDLGRGFAAAKGPKGAKTKGPKDSDEDEEDDDEGMHLVRFPSSSILRMSFRLPTCNGHLSVLFECRSGRCTCIMCFREGFERR